MSENFVKALDKAIQEKQVESRRSHLGASTIGGRCPRQSWYSFRWVYEVKHTGRIRRLFNRGHEEEIRLNRWLRMAGAVVRDHSERLCWYSGPEPVDRYVCLPWEDVVPPYYEDVSENPHHIALANAQDRGPKQWGFKDHGGHFAGSSDGKVEGSSIARLFGLEGAKLTGWGGLEYKTHNEKSFTTLKKSGVLTAKPVHFSQMQVYMHYLDLPWCLYVATNKNDDQIYVEIIHRREDIAGLLVDNAGKIISTRTPPKRISEDPSWYECKFCDYREVCFYGKVPQKNCRSCVFVEPIEEAGWRCNRHLSDIPKTFIPEGCDQWEPVN